MKMTGLTETKIAQAIGKITIDPRSAKASGLSARKIEAARVGVQAVASSCGVISARYSMAAQATTTAARTVPKEDVAADRAILEELFADEYRLTDPAANVWDKKRTIDVILAGNVRHQGLGVGGFQGLQAVLQVHADGTTAVVNGSFKTGATTIGQNSKTGAGPRRCSGIFHTMHAYVFRDNRWQLASSHMTQEPAKRGRVVKAG